MVFMNQRKKIQRKVHHYLVFPCSIEVPHCHLLSFPGERLCSPWHRVVLPSGENNTDPVPRAEHVSQACIIYYENSKIPVHPSGIHVLLECTRNEEEHRVGDVH